MVKVQKQQKRLEMPPNPLLFVLFCSSFFLNQANAQVLVTFLTQESKVLKNWTSEEIQKLRRTPGGLTAQKLLFDESAQSMEAGDRADVDLVTVYGKDKDGAAKMARVPRFMIWVGSFKINHDAKKNILSSWATPSRLKVPLHLFTFQEITKFELSQHGTVYPGTKLKLRTNPAASRGEKLFTQNCLACHSLAQSKPLDPMGLTTTKLTEFRPKHPVDVQVLDARDVRGLVAYSEALASEKTSEKKGEAKK